MPAMGGINAANINNLSNFNNVNLMPGMRSLTGPLGLPSLMACIKTKTMAIDNQSNEVQNTLGITAPTLNYHGVGPLG